jgi:hypothetical protein
MKRRVAGTNVEKEKTMSTPEENAAAVLASAIKDFKQRTASNLKKAASKPPQ